MRFAIAAISAVVCLNVFARSSVLTTAVRSAIPAKYSLEDPKYRHAKKELEELVSSCGPGVVDSVRGANRCRFNVKMDELFFEAPSEKTGLLHDDDWAYQDHVTFFEPKAQDDLPEDFDLRDLMKNGQPEIRKQRCGDCWAWATHHGLEIVRAVHDQKVFDHSVQSVLSCSKGGSCSGGYMRAVDFLLHGLPEEEDFPYAGSNKRCKYSASEISDGWDGKAIATPYVGSSRDYSLARQLEDGSYREGNKVQKMMEAMYQWQAPLVVTVSAFNISGGGVYNNCSAINSGGNHMVTIVGWDTAGGTRNAHVWNSWGPSHGENGVSRIKWECGDGKLNRGLGVSAKIVQYKRPCTSPNAQQTYLHQIMAGKSVQIGAEQPAGTTCRWTPAVGLADAKSCVTTAKPAQSTEYHLTADNACGTSSSMAYVQIWGDLGRVLTPDGLVRISHR